MKRDLFSRRLAHNFDLELLHINVNYRLANVLKHNHDLPIELSATAGICKEIDRTFLAEAVLNRGVEELQRTRQCRRKVREEPGQARDGKGGETDNEWNLPYRLVNQVSIVERKRRLRSRQQSASDQGRHAD